MHTSTLACVPALLSVKLFWIRANRVLAWSLIASPPLQWALGMNFAVGFMIDLVILLVHAGLSFALFGKPETKSATKSRAFKASMHLFGFRDAALSARNRFLLTGYRISGGMLAIVVLLTPIPLVWLLLLYPLLRLPISVFQHMYLAIMYALQRWGVRRHAMAITVCIIVAYVVVSFINLVA